MSTAAPNRTFRQVLTVREFRWLWTADLQSLAGDQLARVGISVLVYDRTKSALLTSVVYGLTYLPALLGNAVLGRLADRLPRRRLLVGGDLIRAGLLATMAIPGVPVGLVAALLAVAVMIGAPWKAAESALVSEVLADEGYVLGVTLRMVTAQGAQVLGFGVGGVVAAVIGAHLALAVDAASFAVSAALMRFGIEPRPAPCAARADGGAAPTAARWSGVRLALGTPRRRVLLQLSWLTGLYIVPEGLAAPYAAHFGEGATAVGVLLAANPLGVLFGSLAFARLVSAQARARLIVPLAMATAAPLVLFAAYPDVPIAVALLFVSGLFSAYMVQVFTEYTRDVPAWGRGQAIAIASAGLLTAQGVGVCLAGLLTAVWSPALTIAASGVAAIGWAGSLAATSRVRQPQPEL